MIVPLVSEEEWCRQLAGVPNWTPPLSMLSGPVLIVAPHPDDETLAAGGLIAHLSAHHVEVLVAAVTDGENAYGPGNQGLAATRVEEQTLALEELGVDRKNIFRFGICDSDVALHDATLASLLAPLIARSSHVVSPWSKDFHPDHEACGRLTEQLALEHGVDLTSYFFWTWHRGEPELLRSLPLVRFPLSLPLLDLKLRALAHHRSQLFRDSGDPILPERLLAPAHRNFEIYLPAQVQHEL